MEAENIDIEHQEGIGNDKFKVVVVAGQSKFHENLMSV